MAELRGKQQPCWYRNTLDSTATWSFYSAVRHAGPAAKYALEHPGTKVVIATGTKALQDQLAAVDVPLVTQLFATYGHELRIVELKGRDNYACKAELDQLKTTRQAVLDAGESEELLLRNQFPVTEDRAAYLKIAHWTRETTIGDLAVAPVDVSESLRRQITRSSQRCHRQECDFYDECFSFVRKAEAAKAHIIIVNYALLMSDLNLREKTDGFANVIPLPMTKINDEDGGRGSWAVNFERVSIIADEAHEMEGFARDAFTVEATHRSILNHCARVAALAYKHKGSANAPDDDDDIFFENEEPLTLDFSQPPAIDKSGRTQLQAVEKASQQVFDAYRKQLDPRGRGGGDADTDQLLGDEVETIEPLLDAVMDLGNYLESGPPSWITARAERLDWVKLLERTDDLIRDLKRLADPEEKGAKSYVRTAKLKGKAVTLEATRIDVAPVLRKLLWEPFRAVVATSATLTAKDGFASFRRRVGANEHGRDFARDGDGAIRLVEVPSPFDYRRNGLLFLPPDAAQHDPRERRTATARRPSASATGGRTGCSSSSTRRTAGRFCCSPPERT